MPIACRPSSSRILNPALDVADMSDNSKMIRNTFYMVCAIFGGGAGAMLGQAIHFMLN
jgi:hypothetical protein